LPALLSDLGLTQEELARRTGIQRTDINAFAKGKREVGPDRLRRLADALGVTIFDLGAPEAVALTRREVRVLDRLREHEAALNALGPTLKELGDRIDALERRAQPRRRAGKSR
jgi:transcriptional regulator with XRE-family HTH domain